jgi:copper chaperone
MIATIQGMSCGHCVAAVEKALKEVKGLKDVKVEVGKAEFTLSGKADAASVKKAIEEAGYDVTGIA